MRRLRSWGPELLVLLGGAVFAILGRGRWASVEADRGYWYSAAQSLLSGGRAMHEVRLQWGPGSLWILEAVGRIFGMHVASFVVFQFVVGLLGVLGVQVFARRFLSSRERWLSAAILVPLIVWMVGPGSLLYPCAFSMSQALFLAICCLLLHDTVVRRGFTAGAAVTGALAALTFLTKQEFGVVAAIGIGALTILSPRLDVPAKARIVSISAIAFLVAYFGALFALAGGEEFRTLVRSNLLWPWTPIPGPWQGLYRKVLGLDDPGARLVEMANSLIDVLAFGGTFCFAVYFSALGRRARIAGAVALPFVWAAWWWRWTEGSHFMPMTLVLPAIASASALMLLRWRPRPPLPAGEGGGEGAPGSPSPGPAAPSRPLPRGEANAPGAFFAMAIGAAILLQREGYRGNIEAFYSGMGYVLAVPIVAWLFDWAFRGPARARWGSRIVFTAILLLLGRFGLGRLRTLEHEWSSAVPFSTPRGTVYLSASFAAPFASTARFIEAHSRPGDPILIMLQTFGLDFLLDRRSLSFFPWVSPGYLTTEDERDLIERCRKTPPAVVIYFEGNLGVFHSGDFGHGFADALIAWLNANYLRQEDSGLGTAYSGRRLLPAPTQR